MKSFSAETLAGKKILIVLLGSIGDVVRGLSLAMRLKRSVPTCHVTWAVEPKSADVLVGHPAVDQVIRFERQEGFSAYRRFLSVLRAEHFDVVLDLQRHFKSGFTSFATRAPVRIGFHPKNAKELNWIFQNDWIEFVPDTVQKLDHYQRFGDRLGLPAVSPLEFGLEGDNSVWRGAETIFAEQCTKQGLRDLPGPEKRVALIVGSSWQSKLWPAERYIELVQLLWKELGMMTIVVGGPSDKRIAAQIKKNVSDIPVCDLTGATSLRELAVVFQRVQIAIGSDSGPMHIAAAVGCPVISIWGATSPMRSGAYGSDDLVLQSSIGCSPCYFRKCPGLDTLCMSDIPSVAVLSKLKRHLGLM